MRCSIKPIGGLKMKRLDRYEHEIHSAYEKGKLSSVRSSKAQLRAHAG